jgi:hypothetical protein
MAFGQPSGPPASAKQVRELLELLNAAGHSDFKDARGPMGFTQRQAAGKFTRDEAEQFIEQLRDEAENGPPADEPVTATAPKRTPASSAATDPRRSTAEQLLRRMPSELLAAELQRRGWVVMEP